MNPPDRGRIITRPGLLKRFLALPDFTAHGFRSMLDCSKSRVQITFVPEISQSLRSGISVGYQWDMSGISVGNMWNIGGLSVRHRGNGVVGILRDEAPHGGFRGSPKDNEVAILATSSNVYLTSFLYFIR